MDLETFKSQLKILEPIVFHNQEENKLRILERTARGVYDVAISPSRIEDETVSKLQSLLNPLEFDQPAPMGVFIQLPYEAVSVTDVHRAVAILADLFEPPVGTEIAIYSDQPAPRLSAVIQLVKALRESLSRPNGTDIQISAPFGEFNETEASGLFDLGVRIRYAAGWVRGCSAGQVPPVNLNALRAFSEFGFRTVIEWFVHAANIKAFEEQISDYLHATFSSGFSLPLVLKSPYYKFDSGYPPLPDALEYCQFLARVYEQHPFYDDVFAPLNHLAMLVNDGGWNVRLDVPTTINFAVDGDGQVYVYKQSPALASRWTTVSALTTTPLPLLRENFLRFVHGLWGWESNAYCRECCWRHICGGLDPSGVAGLSRCELDTMCGYRKLFLQHFAELRASDHVFGETFAAG